eukprot:1158867-Pelagomonas_calceolata.AAC.36
MIVGGVAAWARARDTGISQVVTFEASLGCCNRVSHANPAKKRGGRGGSGDNFYKEAQLSMHEQLPAYIRGRDNGLPRKS